MVPRRIFAEIQMGGIVVHRGGGDIADDAVTLAKMAAGTDGNIISYDASGDPVAIATGDDGQVLTSAGAGQPPAFEDAGGGGGGAWNLIQTVTASTSASLTVTGMSATYDQYCIIFSDLIRDTDNERYNLRMGDSSGIDSGASDYKFFAVKYRTSATSVSGSNADNSADYIEVAAESISSDSDEGFGGVYWVTSPSDSVTKPKIVGQYNAFDPSVGTGMMGFTFGSRTSDIVLDRIQIYPGDFGTANGNIVTGRMTLWGIAHA
jgi:hypothetical protein